MTLTVMNEAVEFGIQYSKLQEKLKSFYTGKYPLVHLSHDDLDGYGCTVISKFAYDHMPRNKKNIPIATINTDQLNNRFYPLLDESLNVAIMKNTDAKQFGDTVNILITDIGNVNFMDLYNKYHELNYHNINIIVIDHHMYKNASGFFNFDGKYMKAYKYNDNTIFTLRGDLIVRPDDHFDIIMLQGDGSDSATLLLHQLLYRTVPTVANDEYRRLAEYAHDVSMYDTGKWGNWALTDYENKGNKELLDSISGSVAEDVLWALYKNTDNVNMSEYINAVYYRIMKGHHNSGARYTNIEIVDEVIRMNEDYATWVKKMQCLVNISDLSHTQFNINGFKIDMKMYDPTLDVDLDSVPNQIHYFVLRGDEKYPPYSFYSKRYLEEARMDRMITVCLDLRDNIDWTAGLRSRAGTKVDVSYIARLNGGGGHFNAAGFPIKPLMEHEQLSMAL